MALLIEVRFLDGRYHGSGDWPPSPARLFQALVAGAARGRTIGAADRACLAWLEGQPAPVVARPPARRGQSIQAWVPNNDLDALGGDPGRVAEIRTAKTITPWLFDPAVPLLYAWPTVEASEAVAARLGAIVERLYQLGRGVDGAWARALWLAPDDLDDRLARYPGAVCRPGGPGSTLVPCEGSLASLEVRHRGVLERFAPIGRGRSVRRGFTQAPRPFFVGIAYEDQAQWLSFTLRTEGRLVAVPLRRAAPLVDDLRQRAAARLGAALPAQAALAERLIVGRGAGPADTPHRLQALALPSIGHPKADPSLRRIALRVPAACLLDPRDVAWAFAGLDLGEGVHLVEGDDLAMRARYEGPARRWTSITPLVLPAAPRTGRRGGQAEQGRRGALARAVATALRHAGIDRPVALPRLQREPFDRHGQKAQVFAQGTRFEADRLWHVALAFDEPVAGPLVLGDGRYVGLGLMRPADPPPGVLAFALRGGEGVPAHALVHAFRRLMMARVRETTGSARLDPFVTGHKPDGSPLDDGRRAHVALAADPRRGRLYVIAPQRIDRRVGEGAHAKSWASLGRALKGVDGLRVANGTRLELAPVEVEADDPLFAPSRRWTTLTPYRPCRHPKREAVEDALRRDVLAECERRGLTRPEDIALPKVERGERGGLKAQVTLRFRTAVPGPILLGRDAMKGGGLFRGDGDAESPGA